MKGILYKKIIVMQAVAAIASFGFAHNVLAIYGDTETSVGNTIGASSLDATLNSAETSLQPADIATNMLPGESVGRTGTIVNNGGSDFRYKIAFVKTGGDDTLCDALHLQAKKGTETMYEGNLSAFEIGVSLLAVGDSDAWTFAITAPEDVVSDKECSFQFLFTAWQTRFDNPSEGGWIDTEIIDNNHIHTGIEAPVQTGYNEDNGDAYAVPHSPDANEIACMGGATNINGVSVHWTAVGGGNEHVKYQRQYKKEGAYDWRGSEIYQNPYTNYRTFGGNPGSEGTYGSRVRAWVDVNNNDIVDNDETVSEWSNECFITYDTTPPAVPTGLRRLKGDDHSVVYECGDIIKPQRVHPDWDDNTEEDFDHYEYTSFNAPNGAIGINERVFYESIFEYNGSWMPPVDGTYGFAVRAVDKAGNKSAWALGGEKTLEDSCQITYDGTAPIVEVTAPTESDTVSGTVEIRGTVNDAHPDHYWLVIENESGERVAGPGTVSADESFTDELLYTWNTTDVPDGAYTIKLEARDALGNKDDNSVQWITVTVNNLHAPTLITPNDDAVVQGDVLRSDWSNVPVAVAYIYESYNDENATDLRWHAEYTESEKTAYNVADATFWWRVKAIDKFGDESDWSELWKVTIDNTAPVISDEYFEVATKGEENDPNTALQAKITWTTNEETDSVVEWGTTKSYGTIAQTTGEKTTKHEVVIKNLSLMSTYHFRIVATDEAGNVARSADGVMKTSIMRPGLPTHGEVVLNEIMPNPVGSDKANKPYGE